MVVALDGSPQSKKALGWALCNLMQGNPNCLLHLLSVEYPVAFPVSTAIPDLHGFGLGQFTCCIHVHFPFLHVRFSTPLSETTWLNIDDDPVTSKLKVNNEIKPQHIKPNVTATLSAENTVMSEPRSAKPSYPDLCVFEAQESAVCFC